MPRKRLNPLAIEKKVVFSHYNVVNKLTKEELGKAPNKPEALQLKRSINDMLGFPTRRPSARARAAASMAELLNAPELGKRRGNPSLSLLTQLEQIPTESSGPSGLVFSPESGQMTRQSSIFNSNY